MTGDYTNVSAPRSDVGCRGHRHPCFRILGASHRRVGRTTDHVFMIDCADSDSLGNPQQQPRFRARSWAARGHCPRLRCEVRKPGHRYPSGVGIPGRVPGWSRQPLPAADQVGHRVDPCGDQGVAAEQHPVPRPEERVVSHGVPGVGTPTQSRIPGTPPAGSNLRTTDARVAAEKIRSRRLRPISHMAGRTTHRSSGMAVARIASKSRSAMGSSAALTQTGHRQRSARRRASPSWSGWTWVSTIPRGLSFPVIAATAASIRAPSPGQPASSSVQPDLDSTR